MNEELANIFEELSYMEEIEAEQDPKSKWKAIAYKNAADSIRALSEDIVDLYNKNKLDEIPGIGEKIKEKIEEYIKTGKIKKYEELKQKYPINFLEFKNIEGIGPKRAYLFYKYLKITNLEQLKQALYSHKIRELPGFGEKSENALINAINIYEQSKIGERKFLALVYDYIQNLVNKLRNSGFFQRVEIAGSTRRMKETIGDIDILGISNNPEKAMDYFTHIEEVKEVISKGITKSTVVLDIGLTCDLRVLEEGCFGAAMQYFTGNKDHNVELRKIAQSKGFKLSEYGLFKEDQIIASSDETQIYNALGLDYIPPELRENMGEIEAAINHTLPKLVEYNEIRGDLHTHTNDSDGANSLEEMVEEAEKRNLEYIAITNHTKSLPVAHGMDEDRFEKFIEKVEKIREKYKTYILIGAEVEILKDGSLDLPSNILHKLDYVIGALHQWTKESREELTKRYLVAINSGLINAIAHPTGRQIGSRPALDVDFSAIFEACEKNNVVCEIDGFPERSDLPYDLVKKAKSYNIMFHVSSDAHEVNQLRFLFFATAIARRGWLEKERILNSYPLQRILSLHR
ncbi:MAG: DNA polymerase/3'-5' exonuclease PolX [Candidatus Parvarchaeota archaeon]|nr:DNA polymerase/3'-5' exonuclease PolX [Candidatus Rehaiarchaeum fermentans]MCW1293000.1 DNA polymerase/3'-5' exonuclease PolX [Candidatus Rehaiarchaeum fermentans]MCW1293439.1 DNA polymerase/3'-5' exonuclease PolX [Candidatus Rehaiarchaeum fermentans]